MSPLRRVARSFARQDPAHTWLAACLCGVLLTLAITILAGRYLGIQQVFDHTLWVLEEPPGGWFEPGQVKLEPLLGTHYFGDYLTPLKLAELENAYSGALPYEHLPFVLVVGKFFSLFQAQIGLALFVLLVAIGFAWAPQFVVARAQISLRMVLAIGVGLLSLPFAFSVDRGNYGGLLTLLMCVYVYGLVKERPWLVIAALAMASCIKIYLLVFLLPLLLSRRFREAAWTVALTVGLTVLSSVLLLGNLSDASSAIKSVLSGYWTQGTSLSERWGEALPLIKNSSMYTLQQTIGQISSSLGFAPSPLLERPTLGALLVLLMLAAGWGLWRNRRATPVAASICAIMILIVPNNVAAYNWGIALPCLAAFFGLSMTTGRDKALRNVSIVAAAIAFTSIPLPLHILFIEMPRYSLEPDLNSITTPILLSAILLVLASRAWPFPAPSERQEIADHHANCIGEP
jgi:hypothetical protein